MSSIDPCSYSPNRSEPSDSRNRSPTQSTDDEEQSYEEPPPRKRIKLIYNGVDRISNLPDALITHILTLMPANDAVSTQLLSKRWRYAWTSCPILTFSGNWRRRSTVRFINNVLMTHKGQLKSLSLLRIDDRSDNGIRPPINFWVQSAINKRIEVLVLEVNLCEELQFLPGSFFLCDSLKELSLRCRSFKLGSSVYWKSLKKLSLNYVLQLSNEKIDKIIESSPELESFNLSICSGFDRIKVSSDSKLRYLVINDYNEFELDDDDDDDKDESLLEISGPCITSLEILGSMGDRHCRLGNVSSLVQVTFRFYMHTSIDIYRGRDEDSDEEFEGEASEAKLEACQKMLLQLLDKTRHVEILSLGTWCTQILSTCELRSDPTVSSLKCKTLVFDSLIERSLPGIARLLRSSPYLEKLTMHTESYNHSHHRVYTSSEFYKFKSEGYWKSQDQVGVKNPWPHLKVVQFIGPFDTEEMMMLMVELAEYMLSHAKALQKLVFKRGEGGAYQHPRSDLRDSWFCVMQKLLSYPRCSHQATVLLA